MTSRREILKAGLAASALPLAGAALAMPSERLDAVALYKVLHDARFPESVAFAARAAEHGHTVHAMWGDVTRFWYDDLYHRWREGPAAIAGLTAYGALFCLEQLAWDQRMRVVFRAEHTAGTVVGCDWAKAMADAVMQCPRTQRAAVRMDNAPFVADAEKLYSWAIARPERF